MNEAALLLGCLVAVASFATVLLLCKTLLYGFNVLNVFSIATATLSAFVFGTLFGLPMDWFGPDHTVVIWYSIAGLIAMAIGIYLAWRPLSEAGRDFRALAIYVPTPRHFNQDLGWLTFWVGALAELLYPLIYRIPTLSTSVYCLSALDRIGLCILLVSAIKTRSYTRFAVAFAIFGVLSVVGSLTSGFTFIRINAFIPLLAIWLVASGITFRTVSLSLLVALGATALVSAWLETRILIRSGSLENLALIEQVIVFFREYVTNLAIPNPELVMRTVLERVDMTSLLAAQVNYQPDVEPYAAGDTVLNSFYTLIPRFLWPEKPEVAGGSGFVTQFTGLLRPVDDETSVGLPYPFELYANGGPLLVVVGLGVIGYVCGRLELRMMQRPSSLGAFWAIALTTAVLCEGGQRTDVVLPALVASALSAYVLGWVIQRFWKQSILLTDPLPAGKRGPGTEYQTAARQ